jgi:hypothetical protein
VKKKSEVGKKHLPPECKLLSNQAAYVVLEGCCSIFDSASFQLGVFVSVVKKWPFKNGLCPPPFTLIKPPRDGAHENRVPDA